MSCTKYLSETKRRAERWIKKNRSVVDFHAQPFDQLRMDTQQAIGSENKACLANKRDSVAITVIEGLSDAQWNVIREQMPSNMTKSDLIEVCTTISSWVREAVNMFVAPALSLTMAIMDERDPEVSRSPSPRISRTSTSSSLVLSLSPSSRSKTILKVEGVQNELNYGSNRSTPSGSGSERCCKLLCEPLRALLGVSQDSLFTNIESEIRGSVSDFINASENRESQHSFPVQSSSIALTSDIFESAVGDINSGLSEVFLQAAGNSTFQVAECSSIGAAKEMLRNVSEKLFYAGKELPGALLHLQMIMASKLPPFTAQLISAVFDHMNDLCGKSGHDSVVDARLVLVAVATRIHEMTLNGFSEDTFTVSSDGGETVGRDLPVNCLSSGQISAIAGDEIDDVFSQVLKDLGMNRSETSLHGSYQSLSDVDQARASLMELLSHYPDVAVPNFLPLDSELSEEKDHDGDVLCETLKQSYQEFRENATKAAGQIIQTAANDITTRLDSTIYSFNGAVTPETVADVVDATMDGVKCLVLHPDKDFINALTDTTLFWESVELISRNLLQTVQGKLRDLFIAALLLQAKDTVYTGKDIRSQHDVITSAKDILSCILRSVKEGLPTCDSKGSREFRARQYLNSVIQGLEDLISGDLDILFDSTEDKSVSDGFGAGRKSDSGVVNIITDVRPVSTHLLNVIMETVIKPHDLRQITDPRVHPCSPARLEKVLSKDLFQLSSTELLEKVQLVLNSSKSSDDLQLALSKSNSLVNPQEPCPVKEEFQKQIVLEFVKTSVGKLVHQCLGLNASHDVESHPSKSTVPCSTQTSLHPTLDVSYFKVVHRSEEILSLVPQDQRSTTALITTAMVTDVMECFPMTRNPSMESTVRIIEDLPSKTPLVDCEGQGKECDTTITEMAGKTSTTKTGAWRKIESWLQRFSCFSGQCEEEQTKEIPQERSVKSSLGATPPISTESVQSLMKALLLKVHLKSFGSLSQSGPEWNEKAISLTGSVVTLMSEATGMPIGEDPQPGPEPSEEMVETVYQKLLQESGSATELYQAIMECSAEVPRAIALSMVREIGSDPSNEFLAAPYHLLSAVLHPGHDNRRSSSSTLNARSEDAIGQDDSKKSQWSQWRSHFIPKMPTMLKKKNSSKSKVCPRNVSIRTQDQTNMSDEPKSSHASLQSSLPGVSSISPPPSPTPPELGESSTGTAPKQKSAKALLLTRLANTVTATVNRLIG